MAESSIVQRFQRERPICVMAQMALERLLAPQVVDALFAKVAKNQYERSLLFSGVARLMASVVLGRQPSVKAAYDNSIEDLGVSLTALYGKLERMEVGLSQALVRHAYAQLKEVSVQLRTCNPTYVAGYTPKILDGNHLAGTEHRLQETRHTTAAPLPGKLLVVLDPRREAIADVFPLEDGHAQERSALDAVIETIEAQDLWIADRNFCTLKFMAAFAPRRAKFVIRLHDKLKGHPLGSRRFIGRCSTGRVFEQKLELPESIGVVRRIEIELNKPTRDEDTTLVILTNLTVAEADALKVADIYRQRWSIETAFCKLTTTLRCELKTLCYPKAAIFTFCLACVAYNAVALVLTSIAAEHGKEEASALSFYSLGLEIANTYDGMMIAIPAKHWKVLHDLSLLEYTTQLRSVASQIKLAKYRKSKRGPKKVKPPNRHQRRVVHLSTAKLLADRKT